MSKDLTEKPVEPARSRHCKGSNAAEVTSLGKPGKAQQSNELKPGELPVQQSPPENADSCVFIPATDRKGIKTALV